MRKNVKLNLHMSEPKTRWVSKTCPVDFINNHSHMSR